MGATSVLLSLIGFLRWVFVVPPLARSYITGDPVIRAAVDAARSAQHQIGGALLTTLIETGTVRPIEAGKARGKVAITL